MNNSQIKSVVRPNSGLCHQTVGDEVAIEKAKSGGPAVMVGDSTWDVEAAEAGGVPTLAVLIGGFSEEELREAGAVRVLESIGELRKGRGALAEIAR